MQGNLNLQLSDMAVVPIISIGMPVFNGAQFIQNALDSLLSQTVTDFELIISDNASTDETENICRKYAEQDSRIRYVRQPRNMGSAFNFKFVLDEARGEYFLWAACDDVRSPDFIEVNFRFLSEHPEFVSSTCPNGFDDRILDQQRLINFALDGEPFERFVQFFNNCWASHGIFYSLVKTEVLRGCEIVGQSFFASDWAIDLYLASKGQINRTSVGYVIFGTRGISRGSNAYKVFRNDYIEFFFPFYRLKKYVYQLTNSFTLIQKLRIVLMLAKLGIKVNFDRVYAWLYSNLYSYVTPIIHRKL